MRVVVRADLLRSKDMRKLMSEQKPFPVRVKCSACGSFCRIAMLVHDEECLLCSTWRPKGATVWPENAVAIALYLCIGCGKMMARWNEASSGGSGMKKHRETGNERWILHCSVGDINWRIALKKLSLKEVEYCLSVEKRKTAIGPLRRALERCRREIIDN